MFFRSKDQNKKSIQPHQVNPKDDEDLEYCSAAGDEDHRYHEVVKTHIQLKKSSKKLATSVEKNVTYQPTVQRTVNAVDNASHFQLKDAYAEAKEAYNEAWKTKELRQLAGEVRKDTEEDKKDDNSNCLTM